MRILALAPPYNIFGSPPGFERWYTPYDVSISVSICETVHTPEIGYVGIVLIAWWYFWTVVRLWMMIRSLDDVLTYRLVLCFDIWTRVWIWGSWHLHLTRYFRLTVKICEISFPDDVLTYRRGLCVNTRTWFCTWGSWHLRLARWYFWLVVGIWAMIHPPNDVLTIGLGLCVDTRTKFQAWVHRHLCLAWWYFRLVVMLWVMIQSPDDVSTLCFNLHVHAPEYELERVGTRTSPDDILLVVGLWAIIPSPDNVSTLHLSLCA